MHCAVVFEVVVLVLAVVVLKESDDDDSGLQKYVYKDEEVDDLLL